jgi:tetratricopeptide (TPR) repeat protein
MTTSLTKHTGQPTFWAGTFSLALAVTLSFSCAGYVRAETMQQTAPGQMPSGQMPSGQMPSGQMPSGQAPPGQPSRTQAQEGEYIVGGKRTNRQGYEAAQIIQQALVLLNQNKTEEALPKLEQAIVMAPDMALAHNNYAIALGKIGRSDEAIAEFQKTITLDAGLPYAWISLAGLYQSQGKIDDALGAYREFLNRFPTHAEASKVTSIIAGLEKVKASMPTAVPGAPQTDYLAEVTGESGAHRWPAQKMPIKIFIQSGNGVPGYKPVYDEILRQCFSDWANAAKGLISFQYVDDPFKSDLECSWSNDPHTLANQAEAGETRLTTNKRTLAIVHGSIRLLTVPLVQALPVTDNRLRTTCLHEIGHALGLTGHTQNPNDIMFFSAHITDNRFELTPRDINTLVRLYSENSGGP